MKRVIKPRSWKDDNDAFLLDEIPLQHRPCNMSYEIIFVDWNTKFLIFFIFDFDFDFLEYFFFNFFFGMTAICARTEHRKKKKQILPARVSQSVSQ